MTPVSTALGEIYQFEVADPKRSLMDLRSILDWQIAPRLKAVPGVVEVNSFGGELKTFEVQLEPDALVAYGSDWTTCFTRWSTITPAPAAAISSTTASSR